MREPMRAEDLQSVIITFYWFVHFCWWHNPVKQKWKQNMFLRYSFFNKQLDVFVYHIRKFDCQQIVTLLLRRLLDLAATFQAKLRCEICLYFVVLFSCSSVIIQCVSKENRPAFAQITSSVHNPPCIFLSYLSLSGGGRRRWGGSELRGRP